RQSTATIVAAWAGRVLAVSLFVMPFLLSQVNGRDGGLVSRLWLSVIAVFMWTGAGQAIKATRFRERLPALQARRLARKAVSVAADTPVGEAIRRAEENQARAVVIVDHEDKPIAILNETAVMATPEQRRPWLEAGARGPPPEASPPRGWGGVRSPARSSRAWCCPPTCPAWRCSTRSAAFPLPSTSWSSPPARCTAYWPPGPSPPPS